MTDRPHGTDEPHEPSGNRWEGQHDTAPVTPTQAAPQPLDRPVAAPAAPPPAPTAPRRGWRSVATGTRAAVAAGLAVVLLAVGGAGFAIGRAVGGSGSPVDPAGRFGQVDGGPGQGVPGDGGRLDRDHDHDRFGPRQDGGQDDGQDGSQDESQDGSQDGTAPPTDS